MMIHERFALIHLWAIFLASFSIWRQIDCKIIGSFILPHGGIALNPSGFQPPEMKLREQAWKIHKSSVDVGQYIRHLAPDLILLSTPHGVADLTKFVFYLNPTANGSAATDNCHCPPCCYDVTAKIDAELSVQVVSNLSNSGLNVSGLSFFGPPAGGDESAVLKWGEVIPLIFIRDLGKSKLIVLSHPSTRYNRPVEMIPQLLNLGKKLYEIFENMEKNVAVVISSDLAHTHDASGPYGYSSSAEPFDKACGHWASSLHPTYLLELAANHVEKALSCGFTGLVMLHGLLEAGKLSSWSRTLYANYHPSYYGMMVASFIRNDTNFLHF